LEKPQRAETRCLLNLSHKEDSGTVQAKDQLHKVLGRRDLILLFVAAVANLNIVPAIAAAGPLTLWLWVICLAGYFWPQGVAVTELSAKWPGEGGVYLWTKNSFGDVHGFLAAWCYWLANVVYLPTVLLSSVGVGFFIFGPRFAGLGENQQLTGFIAALLLLILLLINVRGEDAGKWITNLGGIGTFVGAAVLCGFAFALWMRHGVSFYVAELHPHTSDWKILAIFGTVCYSLQGLDLASIMGDEIKEPRKVLPGAILWGGVISGVIYVGSTFSMLIAMPHEQIGMLGGVLQTISSMAERLGLGSIVAPVALFESIAILGTACAWFSGTARLPFVAGLDRYLPRVLGRLHPKYKTPYVALTMFAILSALLIVMSNVGATIGEAFVTLLSISVILQLIPNAYMFLALIKMAKKNEEEGRSKKYLLLNGYSGFLVSAVGLCLGFVPSGETQHVMVYEIKIIVAVLLVIASAMIFYLRGRSKRVDLSILEVEDSGFVVTSGTSKDAIKVGGLS